MPMDTRSLEARFATAKVLMVDDEPYMRKVVRTLLMSIGVRTVYEAADGPAGLETIRSVMPDVVILDWEMPGLDGAGFVRMRALAADLSLSRHADHHADRPRRALARDRGHPDRASTNSCSSRCRPRRCATAWSSVHGQSAPDREQGDYYGPAPRKLVDLHQPTTTTPAIW